MEKVDYDEVWRLISPTEKLRILRECQTYGVLCSSMTTVLCASLSLGYFNQVLLWLGLITAPIIYQLCSTNRYRKEKPKIMLSFLAARAAARRFAFTAKATDLSLQLLFRAQIIDNKRNADGNPIFSPHWVALFRDGIVLMYESEWGAKATLTTRLRQSIKSKIRDLTDEEKGLGFPCDKVLTLTISKDEQEIDINLTGNDKVALVAMDQMLRKNLYEAFKD